MLKKLADGCQKYMLKGVPVNEGNPQSPDEGRPALLEY